jgi:lysophospholipase L1-like esterase
VASLFAQFVKEVHAALPDARIIVISIKPSILRWRKIDTINGANQRIKQYCSTHRNLEFLDLEPLMLDADGKPRAELLAADGIHLSPAGYRLWTDSLKPLLGVN